MKIAMNPEVLWVVSHEPDFVDAPVFGEAVRVLEAKAFVLVNITSYECPMLSEVLYLIRKSHWGALVKAALHGATFDEFIGGLERASERTVSQ